MAVSGRRRFDDDKVVKYETAEKDFEVEVSRTLNKWCVTVYQMPDKQILVQDFFPERWKALARAQEAEAGPAAEPGEAVASAKDAK